MEQTVTLTIPANWLQDQKLGSDELRLALQLGLAQLRQQQAGQDSAASVVQALLRTGRVRHLTVAPKEGDQPDMGRQEPPTLPGAPVSEILIAQRRGEL